MSRHPTYRWQYGPWRFVLTAGGSYLAVYRRGDDVVPYDMADRPPRPATTPFAFEAACVRWLIEVCPNRDRDVSALEG